MTDNPILIEALRLATLGYPVFPCRPNEKRPATANGLLDATADSEQIVRWWNAAPTANVALRTDGLLVIDIDGADNPWLADQPERLLELADAPCAKTPRGGKHIVFRSPDGRRFRNSTGKLADKIDTRGDGGYILVAPSIVDGKAYQWLSPLDCEPDKLPLPPAWLVELLDARCTKDAPKAEVAVASGNLSGFDAGAVDGEVRAGKRNDTLTKIAGAMRRFGASGNAIAAGLRVFNIESCKPPLDGEEVERTARSVARYAPDDASLAVAQILGAPGEIDAEPDARDVGETPAELLNVPGFIGSVKSHILDTAPYPEPTLAFGAALALQAFLVSRKVQSAGSARPPLYIVTLANSGSGKDWPRRIIQEVLESCGLLDCLGDSIGSGEGLEDILLIHPQFVLLSDEINHLFEAIKSGRDERWQKASNLLLSLYGEVDKKHAMRILKGKKNEYIDQPALTIFGTAIPGPFYGSLSPKMLLNGLFARLILLQAGKRASGRMPRVRGLSSEIVATAQHWAELCPGGNSKNLAAWHPDPIVIPQTGGAEQVLADFMRSCDGEYAAAEKRSDQAAMSVWGRAAEKANRLALGYACSADYSRPTIDVDAAEWSCRFAEHQTRNMLFMAGQHVAETEFHGQCQAMERALREFAARNSGQPMQAWQIRRKMRSLDKRAYESVMESLIAQGKVVCRPIEQDAAGRPSLAYLAVSV